MRSSSFTLTVLLAAGMAIAPAQAESLRFYDTFSGANFQKWWQSTGIPGCAATAGGQVEYATPNVTALLQRLLASGERDW